MKTLNSILLIYLFTYTLSTYADKTLPMIADDEATIKYAREIVDKTDARTFFHSSFKYNNPILVYYSIQQDASNSKNHSLVYTYQDQWYTTMFVCIKLHEAIIKHNEESSWTTQGFKEEKSIKNACNRCGGVGELKEYCVGYYKQIEHEPPSEQPPLLGEVREALDKIDKDKKTMKEKLK